MVERTPIAVVARAVQQGAALTVSRRRLIVDSEGGFAVSVSLAAREKARRIPFWAQTVIGLVVGVALGLIARRYDVGWLDSALSQIGSTFVTLLRAVVVPLILLALIVSISRLGAVANAARLAVQTVVWFAITALIAVTIGLVLGTVTGPGA